MLSIAVANIFCEEYLMVQNICTSKINDGKYTIQKIFVKKQDYR
jgi:hypothetical protein